MGFLVMRYAGRDSGHYGANAIEPAFGDSPPDCRIEWFESLLMYSKKIHIPDGMWIFGTPEGTRDTMEQTPSSWRLAAVHRTAALNGSSPFRCIAKNPHP